MRIAIRGGHNFKSRGAKALIDETIEDRKIKDEIIKQLQRVKGVEVLDVTPSDMGVNDDLKWGVDRANEWGADLFVSIHFNKAYDHYNGAIGSECWTIGPGNASKVAKRIVDGLGSLGFKNRGVKHSTKLYELRKTNMSAIIVEICFVEATHDVKLYKDLGVAKIGKNVVEAIVGPHMGTSDGEGVIYRVKVDGKQIGAYKDQANVIKELKDNWGKVKEIQIERRE